MRIKHILVFLVTVVVSVGVLFAVLTTEEVGPVAIEAVENAVPVSVVQVTPKRIRPVVSAMGEVLPEFETIVHTETGGRVDYVSPTLKVGSQVEKDEILIRLDDSQSAYEVSQAELLLLQANINLLNEESLGRPLFLEAAKKEFEVAQQGLEAAQREVAKRCITAPFSGLIVELFVSEGDLLFPGEQIALLYGTDRSIVLIAISTSDLELLPARLSDTDISLIEKETGKRWEASRMTDGNIVNRETRLRPLYIEIDAPLDASPPLLSGTFVSVQLAGDHIDDVYEIPVSAFTSSGTLWWVQDDTLHSAHVEPISKTDTAIYVRRTEDMPSPLLLVSTPNSSFIVGMNVSVRQEVTEL
jgi:multidrug efflux pump subunit AcrA (membrane-fusion protein)